MDYKGQPAGNPPPPPPPGYSQPPPQYGKYHILFSVHFVEFYLELKSVLKVTHKKLDCGQCQKNRLYEICFKIVAC